MKTSEVLSTAALLIEENGWTQHQLRSEDGAYCLVGAIRAATDVPSWSTELRTLKALHLGDGFAADWNDRPGRTKRQVLRKLRRAAFRQKLVGK